MTNLSIVFFPPEGDSNSPVDRLDKLCKNAEKIRFLEKLKLLCNINYGEWNFKWLEHYNELYQVTQGNFRLYFRIHNNILVVCHVCRKVSQKPKKEDLDRAKINIQEYIGK